MTMKLAKAIERADRWFANCHAAGWVNVNGEVLDRADLRLVLDAARRLEELSRMPGTAGGVLRSEIGAMPRRPTKKARRK